MRLYIKKKKKSKIDCIVLTPGWQGISSKKLITLEFNITFCGRTLHCYRDAKST